MHIENKKHYNIIQSKDTNFQKFAQFIKDNHQKLREKHLIIEIKPENNFSEENILLFLEYAEDHRNNGMSFVVVGSGFNIDIFPENLNVVPTIKEAEDVIEMEEIQRDLGFEL